VADTKTTPAEIFALIAHTPSDAETASLASAESDYQARKAERDAEKAAHYAAVRAERETDEPGTAAIIFAATR